MAGLRRGYIVVFGNEKGGSGKTTTAVHLISGLLWTGFRVASLDLDWRQRSLTRYLENRAATAAQEGSALPCPTHEVITASTADSVREARRIDTDTLAERVSRLAAEHDFIVIDCPGSDAHLSRAAHRVADTLVTPLNDSLLDLDMVVQLDADGRDFVGPGTYSRMVVEQRRKRLERGGAGMDWILLRNRMSPLGSRNSTMIGSTLGRLSGTVGCRVAQGVRERVIYRQLFLRGLTVLDLTKAPGSRKRADAAGLEASYDAARDEIRGLLDALWLPSLSRRLDRL